VSPRPRRTTWVLQQHGTDEFDVLKNNRRLLTTVPRAAAARYIRRNAAPGDRLEQEAEDGYRTPLYLSPPR
jgi:hypothetical protein